MAQGTTSRGYGVNGLNQMTSAATALEYDPRGNLWREGSPAVNTYTYDAENRLTNASGVGLSYDAQGRLYEIVQGNATTRQLYDGVNMIAEYDGVSGALLRRFVHGTGTDEPLVWYEGPGTADPRWLIANQQGSIIAVTGAGGAALAINTYDEYGVPAAGNLGRFQYTGQQWLKEAGLYHYKARAYSPALGRFLQTDPIGYRDGMNWYAYVGNDPLNRADPTGLCGHRKKNGTCEVKVDPSTGEKGKAAGAALEARLNALDPAVQALDKKKKYDIRDGSGQVTGQITGRQIQRVWNTQKVEITSKDYAPINGGMGGSYRGRSEFEVEAVETYAQGAVALGRRAEEGLDTLIFHDDGHQTAFGRAATRAAGGARTNINNAIEGPASAAGRAMADAVGGGFICALPGGC